MFRTQLNLKEKHIYVHIANMKGGKMKIDIKIDLKINLKAFELENQIKQNEKSKEQAEEELNEGFKRIIENMYEESKLADIDEINIKHNILM